jgi:hypothetical protein
MVSRVGRQLFRNPGQAIQRWLTSPFSEARFLPKVLSPPPVSPPKKSTAKQLPPIPQISIQFPHTVENSSSGRPLFLRYCCEMSFNILYFDSIVSESPRSSLGMYVLFVSADFAYLPSHSDPALFSGPSSVHAGQGQQRSTGRFMGSQGTRSDYRKPDMIP